MKNIVILGGGFAGVAAIHKLLKNISPKDAKITLIDKNSYHLFTPSLYEVATSEEPKGNIAIPFKEIFGKNIEIIQAEVERIDGKNKSIHYRPLPASPAGRPKEEGNQGDAISFDYLLVALGSEPAYMHIPGLKENSIALKSLKEAITIKDKILTMCCRNGECNKRLQVIIGGGGFSGTELAGELLTYKNKIAKQHHLDPACLEITIIQGSDRLLKELDQHASKIAQERIKSSNVKFAFGGHINKVTKTSVFTDDNKVYHYDILIWTGGVKANSLLEKSSLPVNKRGQAIVNSLLQVNGFENIFSAGDNTQFIEPKTQIPAPTVAQVAEEEGKITGENIVRLLKNQNLKPYNYRHFGYIVPLRGKYAVAELMGIFHFDGILGWILQQLVFLWYLLGVLPPMKAVKKWNTFEEELEQ